MNEIEIPVTACQGDALAAAVQIVAKAHQEWSREPAAVYQYGLLLASIKRQLAEQHIDWMKGK